MVVIVLGLLDHVVIAVVWLDQKAQFNFIFPSIILTHTHKEDVNQVHLHFTATTTLPYLTLFLLLVIQVKSRCLTALAQFLHVADCTLKLCRYAHVSRFNDKSESTVDTDKHHQLNI